MYKLIDSYDDAFIARTSQDPTDFTSAFTAQTSSDDIFIQGLVAQLEVEVPANPSNPANPAE